MEYVTKRAPATATQDQSFPVTLFMSGIVAIYSRNRATDSEKSEISRGLRPAFRGAEIVRLCAADNARMSLNRNGSCLEGGTNE